MIRKQWAVLAITAALVLGAIGCGGKAPAPAPTATPDQTAKTMVFSGSASFELDLDGDGAAEAIDIVYPKDNEVSDDLEWTLTVTDDGQTDFAVEMAAEFGSTYITDLDPTDGLMDILISYDYFSDDYGFSCFRFVDGALRRSDGAVGFITRVENGVITVSGTVDAMGTWSGTRSYRVTETFSFEPASPWVIADAKQNLAERPLETIMELPVVLSSGAGVLPSGTRLCITETDGQTYALFLTEDGKTGRIQFERDPEWFTIIIDGQSEELYFDMLPYTG
ncbi:MAG: hypothetical protein IJP30_04555 [Clostridia bacterium]|nr:hypothetical protein [Clostridia bacterium]MBQ9988989.1 hypothetical protein [Clostridia bacterium]